MSKCVHFYEIETPSGPTSEGVCTKCGDRRSFINHAEDDGQPTRYQWNRSLYRRQGGEESE